jgi:hypothetical protein
MPTDRPAITQTILFTDGDGRARFVQRAVALDQGSVQARLSILAPAHAMQWRQSPLGFRSEFHCTTTPQWVFILSGRMGIGLHDGSLREFGPGEHFYSADTLPEGASFDPALHGHWSCQIGDTPLVTLFVRAPLDAAGP